MSNSSDIHISDVKDLNEREILLLLIDRVNGLSKKIETFFEVTKNHITRQEYDKFEARVNGDITDIQHRLQKVENDGENNRIKQRTIFNLGVDIGKLALWVVTLVQFFYIIATSKN